MVALWGKDRCWHREGASIGCTKQRPIWRVGRAVRGTEEGEEENDVYSQRLRADSPVNGAQSEQS